MNPFGAAHLSLTDRDFQSQIYWHLSESETGNLQPTSQQAHPPAALAQHLQTDVFLQPGLRVHICNFIILCSPCARRVYLHVTDGRVLPTGKAGAAKHGTAQEANYSFQSKNHQPPVSSQLIKPCFSYKMWGIEPSIREGLTDR